MLFLSATPLEETYQHVWNQLDVFGLGKDFDGLRDEKLSEDQYRREWRHGGVHKYDALVQKKVAELLGSEKFSMSFQIGRLRTSNNRAGLSTDQDL